MDLVQTALGRYVPDDEAQTVLEDDILALLYGFRMNPQNPTNVPMKLSDIVRAVMTEEALVIAALEALKVRKGDIPARVEELPLFQGERTFRISGPGVGFVRNMPQGG